MNEVPTVNARSYLSTPSLTEAVGPAPAKQAQGQPPGPEPGTNVDQAVKDLQKLAGHHKLNINFSVHEATGRTVIKVIDAETNKVLREIPPEEILNLVQAIEEMVGQILNTKA